MMRRKSQNKQKEGCSLGIKYKRRVHPNQEEGEDWEDSEKW